MYRKTDYTQTKYMKNEIGRYRYQQNMSISELARRTGLSATAISNLENGYTSDILLSHAVSLSHALLLKRLRLHYGNLMTSYSMEMVRKFIIRSMVN